MKAFEGSQIQSLGIVHLCCLHKNRESYEDFIIVKGANQILLSGQACLNLKLIKIINNNNKVSTVLSDKEEFCALHSEIFDGHCKFSGKFKITTIEELETVSYHPTKIPIPISDM